MHHSIQHIQGLLQEGRWDEAKTQLHDLLTDKSFIREQAGPAYLSLLVGYSAALAAIQQKYNNALDVGIALLKAANRKEEEAKRTLDLTRLDSEIRELQKAAQHD